MTEKLKILCDHCGADLTETGPTPDYRLHVACIRIPSNTTYQHAVAVSPPFTGDKHFCGLTCLKSWVGWVGVEAKESMEKPNISVEEYTALSAKVEARMLPEQLLKYQSVTE